MKINRRALLIATLAAPVAGCATVKLAHSGTYNAGSISIQLARDWSDITAMIPNRPRGVRLLSVDGPQLNRLYVATLESGESLVKPTDRDTPRPTYGADMSEDEMVEFIIDCIAQEYQSPEARSLRPQNLGRAAGVRFDIATRTREGLNVSGTGLVARAAGKFNAMFFLAPSEYYYDALLPDVEAIFSSAAI